MGKAIRASALMLFLACSASAGVMANDRQEPPPPPPPAEGVMGNDSPTVQSEGIIQNGSPEAQAVQGTSAETSVLVQIALNLLALL